MSHHPCLKPVPKDFDLSRFDAGDTCGLKQIEAEAQFSILEARLGKLQEKFRADSSRALLIVLQAMDTGGKDGTIKHVVSAVDPQEITVVAFKVPTPEDLAHDFLWRIHQHVPPKGQIVIFNRSHYEDVLVTRVHDLVPREVWRARYNQINEFEELLAETGTVILKFYLHISKEEQRKRLQERLDVPEKRWKFSKSDLVERAKWDDYMDAFNDAIARCNTEKAPWYVIPSNHKWYRNWAVTQVLVEKLESLDCKYPQPDLTGVTIPE